jgi:hypothetical protein
MPVRCWYRPVSSPARVGEQTVPEEWKSVDLWSLEVGIAEATDSFVTHVIDHDDDEVGFICGLEKRRKKQGKGEDAQYHAGKG